MLFCFVDIAILCQIDEMNDRSLVKKKKHQKEKTFVVSLLRMKSEKFSRLYINPPCANRIRTKNIATLVYTHTSTLDMASSSTDNNVAGYVAPGWENVRTVFEQNFIDGLDVGAGLCIYYRGQCVINLTGGWKEIKTKKEPYTADNLQLVFSVSKGILAAALARCVEYGWLDYQAPVAKYWPEFAANGKQVC